MSDSPPAAETPAAQRPLWLELVFAGIAGALFFSAFLFLPLAGTLALPLAAVPIVRVAHRRGRGVAAAASAIAATLVLLISASAGPLSSGASGAVFALAITVLPSFFAGSVRRGVDPSLGYLGLCAVGFLLACGFLLARPSETDLSMQREIDRAFDQWQKISAEPARAPTDAETAARLRATLDAARVFTKRFWIGLVGISWVLGAAVSYYLGAWAARPSDSANATRFEELRVPAPVVALFVAAGGGWALLADPASRVCGNLLRPLAALYFVAGLSIICHFARRWFRARILRIGLYALVVYIPINVGVALIGLFDWYADFRHRGREIKES